MGRFAMSCAAVVHATALALAAAGQPATAPRRGGNPEAAKIKNPVPHTPESVAAGRRTYMRLCVRCHGPQGKGDGGGAGAGGQPADLTDATWEYGSSDGEIFSVIHDGTSADMEAYAERLNDTDIWHLVNFIRSIFTRSGDAGDARAHADAVARPTRGRRPPQPPPLL